MDSTEEAPGAVSNQVTALRGLGEDALVRKLLRELPPSGRDVIVGAGAGDDCAVVRLPRQASLWRLLKTDAMIEGVHFLREMDPARVGWKALARVVSDFAAMGGGCPEHALVTLALHEETALNWARELYGGLARAARTFSVTVVGGETARSPGPAFISVALSGTIARKHCILRSGGRPGDVLFVTGVLGGSFPSGRHLDFMPRMKEARWLAERFRVHSMMDLSDGLAKDLPRMARASRTGFAVRHDSLPRAEGCDARAALADGEDYELLFALHPRNAARLEAAWRRKFPAVRLTRIGELTDGVTTPLAGGYDHFA